MRITLLIMLVIAVIYGAVLFVVARYSVRWMVGIYGATMIILFLCSQNMAGYAGGSDPAGNGMERGFLSAFYYAAMILASVAFGASLLWWFIKYSGK